MEKIRDNTQTDTMDNLLSEVKEAYQNMMSIYRSGGNSKEFRKSRSIFENKYRLLQQSEEANPSLDQSLSFLYPSLDDPLFNVKIAERKEFYDTKFIGKIADASDESERLINQPFELAPHQAFVRNFMSSQTPYNSLLLYHGLGTGKTCSGITIAEEMRDYMKQMGQDMQILVVASPNVQENFKIQLFDESKLIKLGDGSWNINGCVGNKLIREVDPLNTRGLSKDKIVSMVKRIISNSYRFLGYIEFANLINRKGEVVGSDELSANEISIRRSKLLNKYFSQRLVIIDEIHEIRMGDSKNKLVTKALMELVSKVNKMRLLLLSATPMFNTYSEIIWLLNILLTNDKRPILRTNEVFSDDGNFIIDESGNEIGKKKLEEKATGYISFVRGENPYLFPYKVWPKEFDIENALSARNYPMYQMNGIPINNPIEHLSLYMTSMSDYQKAGYRYIMNYLKNKTEGWNEQFSFGYSVLQKPIEALNMIFPIESDLSDESMNINPSQLVGAEGLNRIMTFEEKTAPAARINYKYKQNILDKFGRVFDFDNIGKYSSKIFNIVDNIMKSEGIILVYSQYIDGGLVPVALALEELGFKRYGKHSSLLHKPPVGNLNSITMKPLQGKEKAPIATYAMITGDKMLSPDNAYDIKALTNSNNVDGSKLKVILLSQAGGQGLDFANIRQVHVLDPWYNMNRIEQVIGRAVRTRSHALLPFNQRNVMIYLYGTLYDNIEAADLYIYRNAEYKAVKIGNVARVLKSNAIDCLLNKDQQIFTEQNMDQKISMKLSNGKSIEYRIGDKPYTFACDYQDNCEYSCVPRDTIDSGSIHMDTYNEQFIQMNNERLMQRIRELFKEKHFYSKSDLVGAIKHSRDYPLLQIDSALTELMKDTETLIDAYGRTGRLVNVDKMYFFQPIELTVLNQPLYNRTIPIRTSANEIKINLAVKDKVDVVNKEIKKENVGQDFMNNYEKYREIVMGKLVVKKSEALNWYIILNKMRSKLNEEGITNDEIIQIMVAHMMETLVYNDFREILDYIYSDRRDELGIENMRRYVEGIVIRKDDLRGLLWERDEKMQLLVWDEDEKKWVDGRREDRKDLEEEIQNLINEKMRGLGRIYGYMSSFKGGEMVYKIKDTTQVRNKGARCDQIGKKLVMLDNLDILLGDRVYTEENTAKINKKELCVYQEVYMRALQLANKDDKTWFVSPGVAVKLEEEQKE